MPEAHPRITKFKLNQCRNILRIERDSLSGYFFRKYQCDLISVQPLSERFIMTRSAMIKRAIHLHFISIRRRPLGALAEARSSFDQRHVARISTLFCRTIN